MTTQEANKIVLISGTATLAAVFFGKAAPGSLGGEGHFPSPMLFAGTGVTYFGLSVMAEFAPEVAAGLAAAIVVTALREYGIPLMTNGFTASNKKAVVNPTTKDQ